MQRAQETKDCWDPEIGFRVLGFKLKNFKFCTLNVYNLGLWVPITLREGDIPLFLDPNPRAQRKAP